MTPGTHLPGVLGTLAIVARALWLLAWSVLAGATGWAWAFGRGAAALEPERAAAVDAIWRDAARRGWAWTAKATLLSLLVVVVAGVMRPSSAPIRAETLVGAAVVGITLFLVRQPVRRLSGRESDTGRVFEQDRWALTWLLVPVALGAAAMAPGRARVWEPIRATVAAAHLASAGVWLGTIGLLVVLVRSETWKSLSSPDAPRRPLLRPVVEMAGRAAAVLVMSGVAAAAISRPGFGRWAGDYSGLLAAKAAVLVVAAAIAWRQWVLVHGPTPPRRFLTGAMVELGALLAAAGLTAALVGADPLPVTTAAPAHVVLTSAPACMAGSPRQDCDQATIQAQVAAAPGSQLGSLLPLLCAPDPSKPRAYTYFGCLETVGQALATREHNAPDPAITDCTAYTDTWARQSCAGGVFGQLFASETAAGALNDAHRDDPVWPCRTTPDDVAPSCYLLAPSRVLWLNNGDIHGTFTTCDGLSAEWQAMCYQGTGREITTRAGYDVGRIAAGCASAGALGPGPCLVGAARTLVFTNHDAAAQQLCADAGPVEGPACESERQAALATL